MPQPASDERKLQNVEPQNMKIPFLSSATEHFAILEPLKPWIDVSELYKSLRLPGFGDALELRNTWARYFPLSFDGY